MHVLQRPCHTSVPLTDWQKEIQNLRGKFPSCFHKGFSTDTVFFPAAGYLQYYYLTRSLYLL